ncbi:histidine phosphatase family protein [Enterococcus saccharolyticus]|uniref:histidine phosphatase family protein n=1 Tax=Enterococcus saccharolyticus TaxID=41997 RepID=UPI0039E114BE
MKLYLIRHGEPDYDQVTEANYKGFGRDLSRLTSEGIKQAQAHAKQPLFNTIELLLVSPYTRTMQTALELTRDKDIPVLVE